jgi:uncharacterized RDD family membrane protein YckC
MQYQAPPQAPALQGVGVGKRFVAVIIDSIIIGIIGVILTLIFGTHQTLFSTSITGLLALIYYIVLEATRGATVGKMALGIKVVKDDGSPISWSESVIRNLLRIIDVLPFAYIVGAILVWVTSRNQRLGDLGAHTLVVPSR